ncbi:MAG TPA: toll/interleukin-1 receptor domain-containing protein [Candidatus Borkfalkia avistercoris]|uniref:Toll/interleukin-1 receptor domain-containing protein n=1 Tax=Candidatus Borkfalkia avistercoris TaxID=2838504 RepID=A0A9D2D036_9FIRM|nr:toll/interleukin-1 receptor domain-containing protein [Candidatus Borkfalkia avistercoris]
MDKKRIFVSHARTADGEKADEIVAYLEAHGLKCFIAPRDIPGGKPYASELVSAIKEAEVVLLIGTPAVNESEHILNEIEIAINNKKTILHFVVQDYVPSDDLVYYISRKQKVIALDGDYKKFLPTLENELRLLLGIPKEAESASADANKYTVFQYLSDRGIMINPADQHRNVSFRSDTFVTMFSQIYDSVADATDEARAERIFYESGHECGHNFGRRLESTMEEKSEYRQYTPEEKIARWCEFDSTVGWGKFSSDIKVDREEGTLSGKLSISECFLLDRSPAHRHVCAFIRGYCEAVLEVLLGDVEVELACSSCPYVKKFKNVCEFEVNLK